MKDRIKQAYSILLNTKTNVFIALAIIIFIAGAIVVGGILMNFIAGEGSVIDSIYSAMLMIIDPGFLAVGEGFWKGTVSLLIVIFGMIVFLGGTIGSISNMMGTYMENIRMGTKKIYLSNHMLILNWNSRAEEIFVEECYRGENKNILILVADNREEVSNQLKAKKAQLKKEGGAYYNEINVFVRKCDLFSKHDILEAGIERANTVIILDNEDSCRGNNTLASMVPIKILMLISQMNLGKKQTIIVESADMWTKNVISDIAKESKEEIVPVSTNEVLGRILAQISIMPELNQVYGELMSHKGKEFYAIESSLGRDEKYKAISGYFENFKMGIPLNIMEIEDEKWLFVMGESLKEISRQTGNNLEKIALKINHNHRQSKKDIVIIGKNSKQNYIYDCFMEYVLEHGEDSITVHRISTEDGLEMIKDKSYIKEYLIKDDFDKISIQSHLKSILKTATINSILMLSNDMDNERELDSEVLIDLINVKSILQDCEQKPEIVVEILDPRHLDIAKEYGVKSIVFTNQYVSRLITQFGDSRSLYTFFSDLFSYDTNKEEIDKGRFRSKELYVRTVGEVFEELPPKMTIGNFVSNTYFNTEATNPLITLGYFDASTGNMRLFGKNMDDEISLTKEDRLIIYCRH